MPARTSATSATPPNPPIAPGDSTTPMATRPTPRASQGGGGALAQSLRRPAAPGPVLVSRKPAAPLRVVRFNVAVAYDDPPFERSGMLRLQTDPDGKLIAFEAVPPQVEKPAPPAPPFDWNKLFQAAGLEMSQFQTAEPTWTPLANWDTRAAWTGTDPATGANLRIEAAAWRGRPVFFRIIGPWTVPARMTPPGNKRQFDSRSGDHLYHHHCRLCAGLAQRSQRKGRSARRHQALPHLFRLPGIRQSAGHASHRHHRRNHRLLDDHRRRHAQRRPQLGLLRGAGAVGAPQVAAHHDLLDALHLEGSSPIRWWAATCSMAPCFGALLALGNAAGRGAPRQQPPARVPAARCAAGRARGTRRRARARFPPPSSPRCSSFSCSSCFACCCAKSGSPARCS